MEYGLYIHVPFCHGKCYYCDFYSKPGGNEAEQEAFVQAVLAELALRSSSKQLREWSTVYIGGGTPSLLSLAQLSMLIKGIGKCRGEFTIEANPEDVTGEWLDAVMEMGVNRVSMGVQSFDDNLLQSVGRRHTAVDALNAIERMQKRRMNYSIDLIYGLPGQSLSGWERELSIARSIRPPHLSAYLLSYEPGTRLYARLKAGKCTEASPLLCSEMYDSLCRWSAVNGYRHYEVSNFALQGKEANHNSSYWSGVPYLGLGPGAHSFDGQIRSSNPANLKDYIATIAGGSIPTIVEEEDDIDRANDIIITALRTDKGLDPSRLRFLEASRLRQLNNAIDSQIAKGLMLQSPDGHLLIPERHWLISDAILRSLIFA